MRSRVGRAVAGDRPLVVIGHSYGGFIAQELAIREPAAVRGLLLLCTTPGQLGAGEQPAPPGPPMPAEFEQLLSSPPQTDEELAAGMSAVAPAYVHQAEPDMLRQLMADTVFSASAMRRGFEVLADWSAVDRLSSVTAPALVIAGRHDPFTSWPQAHRIAARLHDARVEVFEHSSHFPWLDEPDLFFSTVTGWLQEQGVAAARGRVIVTDIPPSRTTAGAWERVRRQRAQRARMRAVPTPFVRRREVQLDDRLSTVGWEVLLQLVPQHVVGGLASGDDAHDDPERRLVRCVPPDLHDHRIGGRFVSVAHVHGEGPWFRRALQVPFRPRRHTMGREVPFSSLASNLGVDGPEQRPARADRGDPIGDTPPRHRRRLLDRRMRRTGLESPSACR